MHGRTSKNRWDLLIILALGFLAACGPSPGTGASGQDGEREGASGRRDYRAEKNFAALINQYQDGRAANQPWAGAWWAYKRNGTGYWGNGIAANVHGNATPAGKYDAARCRDKTRAQDWEVKNHGNDVKDVEGWWGHCNGWSTAAALFPEPREPVKVNGITFTVADIKAILTEASMLSSIDFFGARMERHMGLDSLAYRDVVPDMFFLVLTNFMGKQGQGVLLDQDTGPAVWNQPIVAYRFGYPSRSDYLGAAPGSPNVHRIRVSAQVWWASDNVSDPGMLTPDFQWRTDFPFDSRRFKMELWLDGPVVFDPNGRIVSSGDVIVTRLDESHHVGGDWKMADLMNQPGYDWEHLWPDYLWVPYQILKASENPDNEREAHGNPYVDIDWVREHLLVPGGADDAGYDGKPCPIPAPPPSPTPSPSPSPR